MREEKQTPKGAKIRGFLELAKTLAQRLDSFPRLSVAHAPDAQMANKGQEEEEDTTDRDPEPETELPQGW